MSKVTMTLYAALCKKKVLEDKFAKILKNSSNADFKISAVRFKDRDTVSNDSDLEEITSQIQSNFSSTIALMENLSNLKSEINDANARIKIKVAGEEMSIANAIARERFIENKMTVYSKLLKNIQSNKLIVNDKNEKLNNPDRISAYISSVLGDSKKDITLVEQVKSMYIKDNEVELYDPLHVEDIIKKDKEKLDAFREQIHFALTEANCGNEITVDFID